VLLGSTDWQEIEAFCAAASLRATKILEGTVWGGLLQLPLRLPADHANGITFHEPLMSRGYLGRCIHPICIAASDNWTRVPATLRSPAPNLRTSLRTHRRPPTAGSGCWTPPEAALRKSFHDGTEKVGEERRSLPGGAGTWSNACGLGNLAPVTHHEGDQAPSPRSAGNLTQIKPRGRKGATL
jgi:hypothetical protein